MLSRTTRILLVLGLVAGAAWLWLGRGSHRDAGDGPERLAGFDAARVDRVIIRRGGETLQLAREDSVWRITDPVSDRAEVSSVQSLFDALEHAVIARNLGAPGDLVPFGLAPPQLRVMLFAGADTLVDAGIGKRTVDDAWTYARAGTRDLVLVPTDLARAAALPVSAFRNQRVLDFQVRDIAGYALAAPDHRTAWMRRGDGWRTVEHGDTIAGDSVAVESVLRRVRGLRVASFVEGADTALAGAVTTLTLQATDGTRFATVRLAPRGGRWIAAVDRDHRTVVVGDDIADLVAHTTNELRDRRLLQFSPPEAARIELALPSASGELVRVAGRWSFPNPSAGRIDPGRAADLVRALRALKWDDPAPPAGASAPAFSVLIVDAGGATLDALYLGAPKSGARWLARSRSDGPPRAIDAAKLDRLAALFQALRAPGSRP